MRRVIAPTVATVVTLIATSCANSTHTTTAHHAGAAGGLPAGSTSQNPTALTTTVQYSGVYDEKIHEDYSGVQLIKSEDKHAHFTFREAVSLTTPAQRLATTVRGTSPISDSLTNKVSFQLSGTLSDTTTPDVANGPSCEATLSGVNGVAYSTSSTIHPPVEITIAALNPDGSQSKNYLINIAATVPDFSSGLGGRAELGGVVQRKLTSGQDGPNFCNDELANGGVMVKDPKCAELWHPGPRETAPGEPPYLSLPLDTKNYSKTYSCDHTEPITTPGITGSDVISASGTLAVDPAGAAYVALGDSFSSGDFPPFEDDACQRSLQAYPELYDSKVDFLACIGRSTSGIAAEQVPEIPANAQVISITAGGDDINLQGIILSCIARQVKVLQACPGPPDLSQSLAGAQANLVSIFRTIHDDKAPNAKIYILGYPDPMPASLVRGSCPAIEDIFANPAFPIGIANTDMTFFKRLADEINAAAQNAANAGDATYVPPDPSFADHTVCSADPWFFPLTVETPPVQKLHPNQAGQQALERELFATAGPAPG